MDSPESIFQDVKNERNVIENLKWKVGEIFVDKECTFNIICALCESDFPDIEIFFEHIKRNHCTEEDTESCDPLQINNTDCDVQSSCIKVEFVSDDHETCTNNTEMSSNFGEILIPKPQINSLRNSDDEDNSTSNSNKELKTSTRRNTCKRSRKKGIICDICEKGFTTERALRSHKKLDHVPLDPFLQDTETIKSNCDKNDDDSDTEEKEKQIDHSSNVTTRPDPLQCMYCKRTFRDKGKRFEHERIHTGERPFQCEVCGKCFRTKSYCTRHEIIHKNIREYKCDQCNMTFKTKTYLYFHMRRHGDKKYACTYCEKSFYHSTEKKQHERTHTGEKPYQCVTCGKCFLASSRLTRHNLKHIGKKEFKCQNCDMCFYSKSLLKEHFIKHTGERPFSCEICNATFPRKRALLSHKKIHLDVSSYSCKICNKGFKQYPGLYCHMKSHGLSSIS